MAPITEVIPSSEARARLSAWLREFREHGEHGEHAGVVYVGSYRRPEAVMLAYERYARIMDLLDDLVARDEIERRLEKDAGERHDLEDVARDLGLDPTDFALE